MSEQGPLSTQIAASIEDVKALLDDNRSLSVAFLSRRIQDLERDVRERLRRIEQDRSQRTAALEDAVEKLQGRLDVAGVKYKEMRDELDQVKNRMDTSSPVAAAKDG